MVPGFCWPHTNSVAQIIPAVPKAPLVAVVSQWTRGSVVNRATKHTGCRSSKHMRVVFKRVVLWCCDTACTANPAEYWRRDRCDGASRVGTLHPEPLALLSVRSSPSSALRGSSRTRCVSVIVIFVSTCRTCKSYPNVFSAQPISFCISVARPLSFVDLNKSSRMKVPNLVPSLVPHCPTGYRFDVTG